MRDFNSWIFALAVIVGSVAAGPVFATVTAKIGVNVGGVTLDDTTVLGTGVTPPDSMGAVGPSDFAEFVNGAFAVYSKTDGSQLGSIITDSAFWTNAGIAPATMAAGLADPRIMYDAPSGRWFATQVTVNNHSNTVLVARSDSSDPTGRWQATSFAGSISNQFLDFDTLGVGGDRVVIGGDMWTGGGNSATHIAESLFSIPKSSLLADTPNTAGITRFDDFHSSSDEFVVQAANTSVSGTVSALAVSENTGKINLVSITEGSHDTLAGTFSLVGNSYGDPPQIHQPDGTEQIDPVDNRLTSAVKQVGNYLYAVNAVGTGGGHAEVHWAKIDPTTNTVVAEGTLGGGTGRLDFFQPSIALSSTGAIVIGCNRAGDSQTGAGGDISSYAFVGLDNGGADVTFNSTPILLHHGSVDNYHLLGGSFERWGDYSATWVDPVDPNEFWTIQEIPLASDEWGTQITELQVLVPEPASGLLAAVGVIGCLVMARRRSAIRATAIRA